MVYEFVGEQWSTEVHGHDKTMLFCRGFAVRQVPKVPPNWHDPVPVVEEAEAGDRLDRLIGPQIAAVGQPPVMGGTKVFCVGRAITIRY